MYEIRKKTTNKKSNLLDGELEEGEVEEEFDENPQQKDGMYQRGKENDQSVFYSFYLFRSRCERK